MIRKTLTIISLLGLLLSVGLWGVSYYGIRYGLRDHSDFALIAGAVIFDQRYGTLDCFPPSERDEAGWAAFLDCFTPRWRNDFWLRSHQTVWKPTVSRYGGPDEVTVCVPLWIPTAVFATFSMFTFVPVYRRRKRKKLGLCLKCGYDLRGSKERCPECGMQFTK